jgi:hypothetical protein
MPKGAMAKMGLPIFPSKLLPDVFDTLLLLTYTFTQPNLRIGTSAGHTLKL